MSVRKQEHLVLFEFDDEEDGLSVLKKARSEEKSPVFNKDERKCPPAEVDEAMGDEIHTMLDKFGDGINNSLLEKRRRMQMYSETVSKKSSYKMKQVWGTKQQRMLEVNNKYYPQFMDLFKQWDLEKQKYKKQQENLIVKTVTNPVDGTEQSDLDRELCIKCVSSVTQDSIYIDKETSFPVHLFSGEFMPCKGDLLLVEYSMKPGTSNMNIHTVSHLSSQNMDEVCVTTIDGRTGVVEASMFFTLDSLHSHPGYTPALYDVVNVMVVDRIQSHYTRRVVSVIPVEMLSIPIIFNPF